MLSLPPLGHWYKTPRRQQGSARLEAVHDAIVHAWDGYKHFSWGIDELQPETRRGTEVEQVYTH